MTILYTKEDIDRIRTIHAPKFTDRNTVSSSDPLRRNENILLLNTFSNALYTPRKGAPRKKNNFPLKE